MDQGHKLKINLVVLIFNLALASIGYTASEQEAKLLSPLSPNEKIFYQVYLNGIKVGKIKFEYKGRETIGKDLQDILVVSSKVKILGLFDTESIDKVYVNVNTHLPLKVEREVIFSGKQEIILEEYNQEKGEVKITQTRGKTIKEKLIKTNPPIHNALSLYFFYPLELKDEQMGKVVKFNLPLRKISIKIKELKKIFINGRVEEIYLLEGSPKRFQIWLKQKERIPLRIEIPVFLGKVEIIKI